MKKIKMIIACLLLYFIQKSNVYAQTITHGPIVGAVTDTSVELLLIKKKTFYDSIKPKYVSCYNTTTMKMAILFVYLDSLDTSIRKYFHLNELDSLKNIDFSNDIDTSFLKTVIFDINLGRCLGFSFNGLIPSSTYSYKIIYDGEVYYGTFKTFPSSKDTSHFSFTLGSCTEQHNNDSIFVEMQKHQPAFFLHLGDWLYTNNFNERKYYYAESLEHQKELYQKRYEMPNLKKFLQTTPMDFVFDDEDGVFDDFSKHSYTELKMNGNVTEMKEVSYPDSLRTMAIEGLHTFFPSYKEVENQAYHSFVYGNTEVFFLDTRSTRSPNSEVFIKSKNGKWKYKVPKAHTILDSAQMNWLLNKLKNSTAQWKFIVSGVTFNKSYKKIIDIAMLKPIQNRKLPNGMTGAYISASLASMWFAFPETQAKLINFCRDNAIKNVIVLSGDAHTAAIDDGTNAGFPELMAGGLAQKNSKIAAIINNNLQLNIWNQGGHGINNNNFNDAFGKVSVNGNQSVTLSCVDKYGKTICSYEVKDGFIPETYNYKKQKRISFGNKIKAAKQALKIKRTL